MRANASVFLALTAGRGGEGRGGKERRWEGSGGEGGERRGNPKVMGY